MFVTLESLEAIKIQSLEGFGVPWKCMFLKPQSSKPDPIPKPDNI